MRFLIAPCLLGLVVATVSSARADDQYKTCIDATGKNDEWARCGGELIKRNEAKMAEQLARLREVAEPETFQQIDAEQRAWSAFRDAACEIYADQTAFGREGQVLSYPVCKAKLVEERAGQLRDYVRQIDP